MLRSATRLLIALFACGALALAELAVPALEARVTDLTGTFSAEQRAALEQSLRAFEALKGAQLAVLVVPSTAPETIEQFGIRVVDQWRLGRAGVDDGLLLLVAKDDRRLRIEVGRGLEGVVPDAVAKRVIAETITPYFRQDRYRDGIEAGMRQLMRIIDGEPLPPPAAAADGGGEQLAFLIVLALVIGSVLRAVFGPLLGSGIAGGITAAVLWFIGYALLAAIGLGLLMFALVLLFGSGRGGGVGAGGGGWSGRGGGGFGGAGGGLRGGGGGFSGGGASGGW